jgi:hypothetical protein
MKNYIYAVAALALMAGCGKDDGDAPDAGSPIWIKLRPTTIDPRRAAGATIARLDADPGGFAVWATANGTAGWWNGVEGAGHIRTDGVWNFAPPVQWPATGSYPMTFYGVYPLDDPGLTILHDPTTQTLSARYTVDHAVARQADLLGARAVADARPADGNLPMVFHHLLARIDFRLDPGADYEATVQGLTVNNVGNSGVYRLSGTPAWTEGPDSYGETCRYFGTIYPLPDGNPTATPLPTRTFAGAGTVALRTDAGMTVMPQTAVARTWRGAAPDSPPDALPGDKSHVAMVYRLARGGADVAGYARADSHPAFAGSAWRRVEGYPPDAPLFVKVGYPFSLAWLNGRRYTYTIALNGAATTTGGYLIDANYYDRYGNRTDLGVQGVAGIATPILGHGDILLRPSVADWDQE